MDWGFGMCSGNTSKKSKKAAIFCLNIPLTKSIDHPWGSWERGSEMERRVLSSNNSYLHPFLPCRCCVVVGRTSALFLREPVRLKLFYASAPRAPIWKLCVSVFRTPLSYGKEWAFFFYSNLFLLKASGGGFFRMWHLGQVKESQLWVQRCYCKWSWKIQRTIFMHSSSCIEFPLSWPHSTIGPVCLLI